MRTSSGKVQAWRCADKGVAMSQANRVQPFVKFTCARPLLIIKKLRPLNYAGEHNLPPPATSYNVNPLINNKLARHAVTGEFHEAQAWRYAGKGAGEGLAMSQLILTRCASRRVCGSRQISILGLRPKPRRCAKLSRMSTLLSLRGRLMAEEGPQGTAQPDLVEGQA